VLAGHRRLVRAAIAAHGGQEVDTQGDAFFAAFGEAKQAVRSDSPHDLTHNIPSAQAASWHLGAGHLGRWHAPACGHHTAALPPLSISAVHLQADCISRRAPRPRTKGPITREEHV